MTMGQNPISIYGCFRNRHGRSTTHIYPVSLPLGNRIWLWVAFVRYREPHPQRQESGCFTPPRNGGGAPAVLPHPPSRKYFHEHISESPFHIVPMQPYLLFVYDVEFYCAIGVHSWIGPGWKHWHSDRLGFERYYSFMIVLL